MSPRKKPVAAALALPSCSTCRHWSKDQAGGTCENPVVLRMFLRPAGVTFDLDTPADFGCARHEALEAPPAAAPPVDVAAPALNLTAFLDASLGRLAHFGAAYRTAVNLADRTEAEWWSAVRAFTVERGPL